MSKRIRLSRRDSVFSTNKENTVDVELKTSSKLLPYPDFTGEVNSQTVYEQERASSDKYRLIVTVNPYCTNVLFNALTEIVKNEGSDDVMVISDSKKYSKGELECGTLYGLENGIDRKYMIDNTEFSNSENGFVYLPGMDMFSNHIIRNTSFKMVCDYSEHKTENRNVFNTLSDYMRYADGTNILYNTTLYESNDFKLKYGENEKTNNWKHLYNKADILGFEDATVFNERLKEENGWYGFKNNSSIPSKTADGKEMMVEKVFNNYDGCEFVDMYPDRTLFSFNPKYNTYRRRLEYNWDVCLTYPYKNVYEKYDLIKNEKGVNALKIMKIERMYGVHGEEILMFRTFSNHGLKKGDMFSLYIEGDGYITTELASDGKTKFLSGVDNETIESVRNQSVRLYRVYDVGDLNQKNVGHFFYINDLTLLDVLGIDREKTSVKDTNVELYKKHFRFNRCKGNTLSMYYLRLFRKLPNFKWRKSNLTEEIAKGNGDISFEKFVNENAFDIDMKRMYGFDHEWYKLAYSNTIYNDDISQIIFTDDIDIQHLTDNLGRKLSDIYVSFLKANRGNKEWYEEDDKKNEESVEFSHAFGDVSSGIRFLTIDDDKFNYILNEGDDNERNLKHERGSLSDANMLNNLKKDGELNLFDSKPLEEDITISNDEFLGDLVDFNPTDCIEHVLDDVMHRFNTKQREMEDNDYLKSFNYREIMTDDYDKDDFALGNGTESDYIDISSETYKVDGIDLKIWQRPEGYLYKPHHSVMFKELGMTRQSSHYEVKVRKCKPVNLDGIYISVTTRLPHNVPCGDIVWACDDNASKQVYNEEKRRFETEGWNVCKTVYVVDKYNFVMTVPEIDGKNWIEICEMINDGGLVLRRRNEIIPEHAFRVEKNKFVWKDIVRVGDVEAVNLPEYTFTNGSFYVNREINFFLTRQDPKNINGLYAKSVFPNDVEGVVQKVSKYEYKEEGNAVC